MYAEEVHIRGETPRGGGGCENFGLGEHPRGVLLEDLPKAPLIVGYVVLKQHALPHLLPCSKSMSVGSTPLSNSHWALNFLRSRGSSQGRPARSLASLSHL
jgi:hypothetical protein